LSLIPQQLQQQIFNQLQILLALKLALAPKRAGGEMGVLQVLVSTKYDEIFSWVVDIIARQTTSIHFQPSKIGNRKK